jgi:hypothetical protein
MTKAAAVLTTALLAIALLYSVSKDTEIVTDML